MSEEKPSCPHCAMPFDTVSYRMKQHVKYCTAGPNPRKRASDVTLKCYFCAQEPFKDFAELSQHVRYECLGSYEERIKHMNIGKYVQEGSGGNRLDLLDPKLFKKLSKKGVVTAKMIACREIKSPKFAGLAMDFMVPGKKFAFLARFDRWDITALAKQCKSEDTDDWIGEHVRFVAKKSTKGQTFVNVELPKAKKKK